MARHIRKGDSSNLEAKQIVKTYSLMICLKSLVLSVRILPGIEFVRQLSDYAHKFAHISESRENES